VVNRSGGWDGAKRKVSKLIIIVSTHQLLFSLFLHHHGSRSRGYAGG
jgi:hypothetical protein